MPGEGPRELMLWSHGRLIGGTHRVVSKGTLLTVSSGRRRKQQPREGFCLWETPGFSIKLIP